MLCPVDDFGVKAAGSWYLGEQGDLFWLTAMPALIRSVHAGDSLYFSGSSMGGYGAILHGILNRARAVYANVPQTRLLGSAYSNTGMKKYFQPIFGISGTTVHNDLRNFLSEDVPTTFFISGQRHDFLGSYLLEQTLPFLEKMIAENISFQNEIRLGCGHGLTHTIAESVALMQNNKAAIEANFAAKSQLSRRGQFKTRPSATPMSGTGREDISLAEKGSILLREGLWTARGFGPVRLVLPIDWSMDPFSNRSWVWLFHQFAFMAELEAHDRSAGSADGALFSLAVAQSWWHLYADFKTAPDFAWHDHGSALRALNLLSLHRRIRGLRDQGPRASLSDGVTLLDKMLDTHACFLADETCYSKGNNHGLEQSFALFRLAASLPNRDWAVEFMKLASGRITSEISGAFAEDGGHLENSVAYQDFGIRQLLKAHRLSERYPGKMDLQIKPLTDLLERATRALTHMIAPDGSFPIIGDTPRIRRTDIFAAHSKPAAYPGYLFALSGGTEGVPDETRLGIA